MIGLKQFDGKSFDFNFNIWDIFLMKQKKKKSFSNKYQDIAIIYQIKISKFPFLNNNKKNQNIFLQK